jgi:cysteinyl-tRNA synthetase
MSMKYLGAGFDVHGGGLDLVFPHHENEMAQAEAYADGQSFVRYWMHSGMLNIDQEKMSKSLGNIKPLREVLEEYDADTIRMLMLGTHYRSPLSFSDESLTEARASFERIENCLFNIDDAIDHLSTADVGTPKGPREVALDRALGEAADEFRRHMEDDFNSAAALGVIFGAVREVNTYIGEAGAMEAQAAPGERNSLAHARRFLEVHCGALGLFQGGDAEAVEAREGPDANKLIELLRKSGKAQTGLEEKTAASLSSSCSRRGRKRGRRGISRSRTGFATGFQFSAYESRT